MENIYLLQIGACLCYKSGQLSFITNWGKRCCKLGQLRLLQIGQNVIKSWGSYYKLQNPLLSNVTVITIWNKFIAIWVRYYKLGKFRIILMSFLQHYVILSFRLLKNFYKQNKMAKKNEVVLVHCLCSSTRECTRSKTQIKKTFTKEWFQ